VRSRGGPPLQHLRPVPVEQLLVLIGAAAAAAAVVGSPHEARAATEQTWSPFVLVVGLLMIGVVAHRDGLFDALGDRAARLRAHPAVLLVALLGIEAAVTVVLNLDTAVAFMTPVLVLAARAQSIDEDAFMYGSLFMANAASLVLPGSNLTNLLVLAHERVSGSEFATRMLPASLPPIIVTALFVAIVHRHRLVDPPGTTGDTAVRARWLSTSTVAIAVAATLVLVLRAPALPVFAIGLAAAAFDVWRQRISHRAVWDAIEPLSVLGLFGIAVALGTLARGWNGPAQLTQHANGATTAVLGALTAVAVNNLPAAVLLSARGAVHPRALLIGLNLGPNLAVTGSLSSLIWYRAARTIGAKPSARRVSKLGLVLVPLSIAAAALTVRLLSPARL
jgi:arsenical pump membrane protein